jgi:hypothetical protein
VQCGAVQLSFRGLVGLVADEVSLGERKGWGGGLLVQWLACAVGLGEFATLFRAILLVKALALVLP